MKFESKYNFHTREWIWIGCPQNTSHFRPQCVKWCPKQSAPWQENILWSENEKGPTSANLSFVYVVQWVWIGCPQNTSHFRPQCVKWCPKQSAPWQENILWSENEKGPTLANLSFVYVVQWVCFLHKTVVVADNFTPSSMCAWFLECTVYTGVVKCS